LLSEQDDWANYTEFTKAIGKEVQVVGDDLLVTNVSRIQEASGKKACNALLLKVRVGGPVIFADVVVDVSTQLR
jgi:enolase